MQCVTVLKKRSLEPEPEPEPRSCRAKRVCLGVEIQVSECPMETSHMLTVSNQQPEQQVQVGVVRPRPPPLLCSRCLGGEPGHINHILGH